MLHVGALGTDFNHASLCMRDALYIEKDRVVKFLESIPVDAPICEVVALSTCNRIEIYYVCSDHAIASAWLRTHLITFHHIPPGLIDNVLREYRCDEAIRHLFKVVSGVESMVFGENEILGQVRDAYFHCMKNDSTDSYCNRLFQQAIATGKRVRNATGAGKGALSIASIAVEKIMETNGDLSHAQILIVGTGTMGIRALKRLQIEKVGGIALCNRTEERAIKFAQCFGVSHVKFSDLIESCSRFDVVMLAAANDGTPLVSSDQLERSRKKSERKLLIVDLGAPSNVEASITSVPGVNLVAIDDLREIADSRLMERENEIDAISDIIEEQVREFTRWYRYKSSMVCGITK